MTRRTLEAEIPYVAGLVIGMVLVAPAFIDGYFDRYTYVTSRNDFASFWVGARAILEGHDPYRSPDWPALAATLGGPAETAAFGYPGWTAVLLLPLAILPVSVAAAVWTVGGLVAAILALRWLLREALPSSPLTHTVVGITLIASQPSRIALYWGQWQFLLIAALIAAIALLRHRPVSAGAAAAVLLAKPHLFVLTLPALALRAAAVGRARRFILGLAAVAAVAFVVSLLLVPGWVWPWVTSAALERMCNVCALGNVLGELSGADPQTTRTVSIVGSALATFVGAAAVLAVVAVAALVMSVYPPRSGAGLGVWITLSLIVTPYLWSHDHLLLLPASVLVAGDFARAGSQHRATVVVAMACTTLVIVESVFRAIDRAAGDRQLLQSLVPVLVLVLFAAVAIPRRGHPASARAAVARPT